MPMIKTAEGWAALNIYVNISAGLIFKTEVRKQNQLHKVLGRSVKIETCEMNTLRIGSTWFEIVGYYGPLAHVKEMR